VTTESNEVFVCFLSSFFEGWYDVNIIADAPEHLVFKLLQQDAARLFST
jgi:hypothetical protein